MRCVDWDNMTKEEQQELLEIESSVIDYYYRVRMRIEEEQNHER